MRRWAATWALAMAATAFVQCSLDLKPFVDPVDAGGSTVVEVDSGEAVTTVPPVPPEAGPTDAGVRVDATPEGGALPRRIFVSSTATNAALQGLAGADLRCQQLAIAAGLGGAKWVAWLSAVGQPAIGRITSDGPWVLVDGKTRIFASRGAIVAVGPEVPISLDETGKAIEKGPVWTGTGPTGAAAAQNCTNFTNGVIAQLPADTAVTGQLQEKNEQWTQANVLTCSQQARIYCLEN